jgi:iron complex transport system ATP-binding protein
VRPALYANDVTVRIGPRALVRDFDLTVGRGDWLTIVGPNGAGKTTLLRALAGLVPASGRIELFGTALGDLSTRERARCIAFVPQSPRLPTGMTVAHYVMLGRTAHLGPLSVEGAGDHAVVERSLAQLALSELADRSLDTLSGGERQRAVLARGLTQEAALLFLDEPTTALDIGHQQEILELVDTLRHELELTVVATMHDLTLAAQYGDQLVLMDAGRAAISGPPVQVLTSRQLQHHYGAHVDVIRHRGNLVVVPRRGPVPSTDAGGPHDR